MTRRGWIALCAAWLAARPRPARAEHLAGLFSDRAAAGRLGQAYAATVPQTRDGLAALVWEGLPSGATLRGRVAASIEADFAAGRMACVDGWLLSVTEARLCALAA